MVLGDQEELRAVAHEVGPQIGDAAGAARGIDAGRPEPAWAQALLADARGDAEAPRLVATAIDALLGVDL